VVTNVPYLGKDSLGDVIRQEILYVVNTLQKDSFWSAQSAQIMLNDQYKFELMPVAGNQRIILGDTSRLKDKLENVYLFYVHVLNKIGWDKYEVLDARFANQVVATPSLPYKGPVDKSAHDFDWVNSIVVTQARIDSVHQEADIRKAEAASKASAAKLAKARLESKGKGKLNIPILMPSVRNGKVNVKTASKSIPTPSKANVAVKQDAKGAKAAKPAERIIVPDLKAKKEKEKDKGKDKVKEKESSKEKVKESGKGKEKEKGKESSKEKVKEKESGKVKEKAKEKVSSKEKDKVKESGKEKAKESAKVKESAKAPVKEAKKEEKNIKKEEPTKAATKVPKAVLQENKN
jgi:cell division protein FtsQ